MVITKLAFSFFLVISLYVAISGSVHMKVTRKIILTKIKAASKLDVTNDKKIRDDKKERLQRGNFTP
ncbi:hypothetical protein SESBI_40688 [Sesbania bispinosa]|nr:hypothetical protein SESBI_40688 [Sesbania bispinosa]